MDTPPQLVIFGCSDRASLVHYYFKEKSPFRVAAFTVDDEFVKEETFEGLPVVPWSETLHRFPPSKYFLHEAVGYTRMNQLREEKYQQLKNAGYVLPSVVDKKTELPRGTTVGENCVIIERNTVLFKTRIGNNVMIGGDCHLSHDTVIKDHAWLAAGILIAGCCEIGERSFVSMGATFGDNCHVGSDCLIGANALVTGDVPAGWVVLPPQGAVLEDGNHTAQKIKRKYFGLS